MKKVRGILVDTESGRVFERTLHDSLEAYYDSLHCTCIDIVERKIGGKYYSIVCDDEGLFSGMPIVTAVDSKENMMLVGSLFICNSENGEMISLADNDVEQILEHVEVVFDCDRRVAYELLHGVDF